MTGNLDQPWSCVREITKLKCGKKLIFQYHIYLQILRKQYDNVIPAETRTTCLQIMTDGLLSLPRNVSVVRNSRKSLEKDKVSFELIVCLGCRPTTVFTSNSSKTVSPKCNRLQLSHIMFKYRLQLLCISSYNTIKPKCRSR